MNIQKTILLLLIIAIGICAKAQEHKIPVDVQRIKTIEFTGFPDDLVITGHNGNEIIISKQNNGNNNQPSTGIKTAIKAAAITLSFDRNAEHCNYKIQIPHAMSIVVYNNQRVSISNINNDVTINNCGNVKIANTTRSLIVSGTSGSIAVENCVLEKGSTASIVSISGNIMAQFHKIESREPILLNSISGNVIVELPNSIETNIKIKTTSGTIKSDLKFPEYSKNINQILGDQINYIASKNAATININTVSGNILLKNKK